jgi:Putative NADH-flavin reductase
MKITVFGASGAIGKLLVKRALEDGYVVKAYVRNPAKFDIEHPNLELIKGELYDYENVKNAILSVDCVISTLGPPVKRNYEGFPVLEGHKNIIKAMNTENVKRFITIATPSVKFERDVPSITTKLPTFMAKLFLPKAYKEIVQIGEAVSKSGLDWTIVRFIAPNNTTPTGNIKVTFGDKKIKFGIPRADIAGFILQQTKEKQYIHSMPIIGR